MNAKTKCSGCGMEMQSVGSGLFRMGEREFPTHFAGPRVPVGVAVPFDVRICSSCGKVELYVIEETMDALVTSQQMGRTPRGFLKKCVACKEDIPIASEECKYCGARQSKKK